MNLILFFPSGLLARVPGASKYLHDAVWITLSPKNGVLSALFVLPLIKFQRCAYIRLMQGNYVLQRSCNKCERFESFAAVAVALQPGRSENESLQRWCLHAVPRNTAASGYLLSLKHVQLLSVSSIIRNGKTEQVKHYKIAQSLTRF